MARHATNKFLTDARKSKSDEFYTILADVEKELKHYKDMLRDKAIYCNCDDPYESNFFKFFAVNFNHLGLKRLITTSYKPSPIANTQLGLFGVSTTESKPKGRPKATANKFIINEVHDIDNDGAFDLRDIAKQLKTNKNNEWTPLAGDGDFRSQESIELLKQADIVITNPPFSLFREYVAQLVQHEKKFLIIGTWNAITYKEIFNLVMKNKLWIGINSNRNFSGFIVPQNYDLFGTEARIDEDGNRIISSNNTCWFTNLDNLKRHEELVLYKTYTPELYPKYDNCDAIEVSKVNEIPMDYKGVMGVPITFMNKYNPDQFEIVGLDDPSLSYPEWRGRGPELKGKTIYRRIMIKNRKVKK